MGLFAKWVIVNVSPTKIIITNQRLIVPVYVVDGRLSWDQKRYRLPKQTIRAIEKAVSLPQTV